MRLERLISDSQSPRAAKSCHKSKRKRQPTFHCSKHMRIPRYNKSVALALAALAAAVAPRSKAGISLIANGSISGTALDYSGSSGNLENGQSASLLGGLGSGLSWAGGTTFLGLPDRGPNAVG